MEAASKRMIGMMQSRADNGGDGRREGVIKLSVSGFLHQADAKSAVNSNHLDGN